MLEFEHGESCRDGRGENGNFEGARIRPWWEDFALQALLHL